MATAIANFKWSYENIGCQTCLLYCLYCDSLYMQYIYNYIYIYCKYCILLCQWKLGDTWWASQSLLVHLTGMMVLLQWGRRWNSSKNVQSRDTGLLSLVNQNFQVWSTFWNYFFLTTKIAIYVSPIFSTKLAGWTFPSNPVRIRSTCSSLPPEAWKGPGYCCSCLTSTKTSPPAQRSSVPVLLLQVT